MFRSYTKEFKYKLRDKLDISEFVDIFTGEDMENTPLESRMWFRMNFTSLNGIQTYDLCDTDTVLYQMSCQAIWDLAM